MDYFNWMVMDMITRDAVQERLTAEHRTDQYGEAPEAPKRLSLVTRALASSLVRLGLRLDPAAGEGLDSLDLSLAQTEARS